MSESTAPSGLADGADEVSDPTAERRLDATSIQGLAHPLRVQMLELLGLHGPATATQLAARVGESSGATSYHLRQLEKYGFIEEDPDRGSGRERWWRRTPGRLSLSAHELDDDPVAREAASVVLNEWTRSRNARHDRWGATYAAWPVEWIEASLTTTSRIRLNVDEFAQLGTEIGELVNRWMLRARDREHDERYVDVELQAAAFPLGDPPGSTQ